MSDQRKKILKIVGAVACVLILYFCYRSYRYVSTDNATVEAEATFLSSRVGGIVTEVLVNENQSVKMGEVLAKIRPSEYQNSLVEAESNASALEAELKAAERSYQRTATLLKSGASTQERLDAAEARYRSLQGKVKLAQAQVVQAKLDFSDTDIKAPNDGTIAKKSIEVGMMASAGQPVFGFITNDKRWVTANFKETEIKGMIPGKAATVEVDAIPGHVFHGVVESLSPSTGAVFSLLPPDNATGNFTKVVQRVPVRVKLVDLTANDIQLLRAGLSADVTVTIH